MGRCVKSTIVGFDVGARTGTRNALLLRCWPKVRASLVYRPADGPHALNQYN